MTGVDARVVGFAIVAGVVTLIAPVALGGATLAVGVISAILTTRAVVRSQEGDVTTAIVAGGVVVGVALSRGHLAAMACAAGVFAGAEIAELGRRLDVDRDAPTAPEVVITAATIAVGLAAGVAVAALGSVRAGAIAANAALGAAVVLGVVVLAGRRWRDE